MTKIPSCSPLGDGADGSSISRALADYVIAQNPDRFFYLGDVYETGTAAEFAGKYEPLYGALGEQHRSGDRQSRVSATEAPATTRTG